MFRTSDKDRRKIIKKIGIYQPTTGFIGIWWLLKNKFNVYIYNFDFYSKDSWYYYGDSAVEENKKLIKNKGWNMWHHQPEKEKVYIEKLIKKGKVHLF